MGDAAGFRLSPIQRRLWQRGGSHPAFRVQCALAVPDHVEPALLRRRLATAVAREPILRARFTRVPGLTAPIQVIDEEAELSWEEIDAGTLPSAADELLERARRKPIDHEHGPIVQALFAHANGRAGNLLLSLPSLCGDAATMSLLVADLAGIDREAGLPYTQFADWQNEVAESAARAEPVARWAALNAPPPDAVRLALARPAPADAFAPRFRLNPLPAVVQRSLHDVARDLGVASESLLLACWHSLLSAQTGRADLVVGVRADGRNHEVLAAICGPVARSIPQRVSGTGTSSLVQVAREVDADLQHQHEHGIYFTGGDTGTLPFLFARERWPHEVSSADGRFTVSGRYVCSEPFALQLTAVETDGDFALELGYDAARLSDEAAEDLYEQYATLLGHALRSPTDPLGSLNLLSPRARQAMVAMSAGATRAIQDESLAGLFERQAATTPNRVAIVDARQEMSYQALDAAADGIAQRLQGLGIRADALVGLLADRSAEALAGLLGILKASAVVVPLDPTQPAERWRSTPAGAAIRAIVGGRALIEKDEPLPTIAVSLDTEDINGAVTTRRRVPDTLAYTIFTSGSSGQPKAVAIEQRAVVNLLASLHRLVYEPIGSSLRVAVNAPLTFDASVKQWMQLLHGHTLCLVPEDVRLDMRAMLAWLAVQRIEVLDCTPAQLQLLVDAGLDRNALPHLKALLVGGEAIDQALWTALRSRPEIRFYNVYGPTECTVDATACDVTAAGDVPVIGRPLDNTDTYVLDERLEPVPVGVEGELFIGGAGVARGYLYQPALTAERFLPNPFATAPGSRLYRTGDRARWLADGVIEYRGRCDRQVKISGYRVEPAEIEAALLRHPGIHAAAVTPATTEDGRTRLNAYVVAATNEMPDDSTLRAALRQRLPEFMLPDRIARVDRLPLTANAKVDYQALSARAEALPRRSVAVAPRNELERTLAEIWREVLQRDDPIGVDDNFFDVGGHSLLLLQLHSRLRESIGRDFAVVDLFRRPTIASFAAFLSEGADPSWSRAAIAARAERQRQASRDHQGWRSRDQ